MKITKPKTAKSLKPSKLKPAVRAVPEPAAGLALKQILVPTDFSEQSQKALRYAIGFAEQFRAAITLLHVFEPFTYPAEMGYVPAEMQTDWDSLRKAATEHLDALAKKELTGPVRGATLVRSGSPFNEIVAAARELDVDLIIIATHGYSGLKHLLLGSTAERVVRHAPCPVLVVRQRERDFVGGRV